MVGHASALACLAIVATLRAQAAAPSTQLYACQNGQCVPYFRGLPLVRCEQTCTPAPSANYTCQGGQCVVSGRGLPKKECTQVCGGPGPAPGGKTIVDLAVATPDLSTLVTALKAGGLVGTLSGQGPFTVFAPTNEAFTALPNGVLANLLKPENKAKLDDVLTYHVVAGTVRAEDLKDGEKLRTLEGKELTVRLSGKEVLINSAKVTTADVNASNGVVHIIDEVLLPAGGPAPPPGPPGPGPPPGPAEHLWFRFIGRKEVIGFPKQCGEIDAAIFMPTSIFDPANAAELALYKAVTIAGWGGESGLRLAVGRCGDIGFTKPSGAKKIQWVGELDENETSSGSMTGICEKYCHCHWGLPNGHPPYCTNQTKDDPKHGTFCTLCGPKDSNVIGTVDLFLKPQANTTAV